MPETIDWPIRDYAAAPRLFFISSLAWSSLVFIGWHAPRSPTGSICSGSARSAIRGVLEDARLEWGIFAAFAAADISSFSSELLRPQPRPRSRSARHSHDFLWRPADQSSRGQSLCASSLFAVSLLICLGTGAAMKAQWPTLALYWHAPHAPPAVADPIFGKPLNFYLFTLPAWHSIAGWLLTLAS